MCTAQLPLFMVMLSILSSTVLLSQILNGRCRPPPEVSARNCLIGAVHSNLLSGALGQLTPSLSTRNSFLMASDTSFSRSRSRNTPRRRSKSRGVVRAILGHGQALGADADGEGHGCTHASAEKLHVSHANPRVTAMVGQNVLRLVAFRRARGTIEMFNAMQRAPDHKCCLEFSTSCGL